MGVYYYEIGAFQSAEELLRRALEIKNGSVTETLDLATYQIPFAWVLLEAGQLEEAERLCEQVVKANVASSSKGRSLTVKALTMMAQIYDSRGNFCEGEKLHNRALDLMGRNNPEDPIVFASVLNNLALILIRTHRSDNAETLLRTSLRALEEKLGSDSPTFATVVGNFAYCRHQQAVESESPAAWQEAESLYRRALEIDSTVYGDAHPIVARDANNLGFLFLDTGKFDEAEPLLRSALKIQESARQKNDPSIAATLNNWGRVLNARRRYDEAKHVFERALSINYSCFGKTHEYAKNLVNLCTSEAGLGNVSAAEKCLTEALAIDEVVFGRDNLEVGRDLMHLGMFYLENNRYNDAEKYFLRTERVYVKHFGSKHKSVLDLRRMIETVKTARLLENKNTR